ncbi:MAG: hypothetical protein V7767_08965 [Leeuwenhoekiella sp.]
MNNHHTSHFENIKLDTEHDKEHLKWNRRTFLQMLGLAGGGTMMLGGSNITAASATPLNIALSESENDKIIILIRLKGGNDGLNTIVPLYDYDTYARKRPTLRFPKNKLYKLSNDFGISSSLSPLQSLWGDGKMKVAHGVGYPNQNLSHYTSADIWATGDLTTRSSVGVMGKYFEGVYPDFIVNPPKDPAAIQIGDTDNLLFEGPDTNYSFSLSSPKQLASIAKSGWLHDPEDVPPCTYGDQVKFMRTVVNSTLKYAESINKAKVPYRIIQEVVLLSS